MQVDHHEHHAHQRHHEQARNGIEHVEDVDGAEHQAGVRTLSERPPLGAHSEPLLLLHGGLVPELAFRVLPLGDDKRKTADDDGHGDSDDLSHRLAEDTPRAGDNQRHRAGHHPGEAERQCDQHHDGRNHHAESHQTIRTHPSQVLSCGLDGLGVLGQGPQLGREDRLQPTLGSTVQLGLTPLFGAHDVGDAVELVTDDGEAIEDLGPPSDSGTVLFTAVRQCENVLSLFVQTLLFVLEADDPFCNFSDSHHGRHLSVVGL